MILKIQNETKKIQKQTNGISKCPIPRKEKIKCEYLKKFRELLFYVICYVDVKLAGWSVEWFSGYLVGNLLPHCFADKLTTLLYGRGPASVIFLPPDPLTAFSAALESTLTAWWQTLLPTPIPQSSLHVHAAINPVQPTSTDPIFTIQLHCCTPASSSAYLCFLLLKATSAASSQTSIGLMMYMK